MNEGGRERGEVVPVEEQVLQIVLAEIAERRRQALDRIVSHVQRVQRGQVLSKDVRNFIQSVIGDAELLEELEVADLGDELGELVVVKAQHLQAHQRLDVRVDAFDLVVPQIKLLKAGKVLTEIAIELGDAVVLEVEDEELLKRLALEAQRFGDDREAAVLQGELVFDRDLLRHRIDSLGQFVVGDEYAAGGVRAASVRQDPRHARMGHFGRAMAWQVLLCHLPLALL